MGKNHTLEIRFDAPESFVLTVQTTMDGDAVTARQAQLEDDQRHAEQQQPQLYEPYENNL